MKKHTFFKIGVLAFGLVLVGCSKTAAQNITVAGLQVTGEKAVNDLDSTFKVQATLVPNSSVTQGTDLGIVGTIQDGKLTMSVPNPTEDQLFDPKLSDIPATDGLKVAFLCISTSKDTLVLRDRFPGDDWGMETIEIWWANKDGAIGFYSEAAGQLIMASVKQGWNFIVPERLLEDGEGTWTSLQEANEWGFHWGTEDDWGKR
jgi:hypothetical protein